MRARVRRTEVGGISCVFLDTTSTILQPVTVSGHLAAVTVSNVGLQIRDQQVLQAVRALTGRRSGEVWEVCGNIIWYFLSSPEDLLLRTEMSGGADDDQVVRSAQVLIQASQLTVGELTCYRDSPHISLLGPALASANTLVSLHLLLLTPDIQDIFWQVLNDVTFSPNQWREIIDDAIERLQEKKGIWSEVCLIGKIFLFSSFGLSQVYFIFWNWNPLRLEETEALKFLKIFPQIKNIKFVGNGFRHFPTVQHWIYLSGLVRKNERKGKLLLDDIDVSDMLWGTYSGLPDVIQQQLTNIQNTIIRNV